MPVYELGSMVPLSATIRDAGGALVDVTGDFTFVVTHADGTGSGDLVAVRDSLGQYHFDWTPTKIGRYSYSGAGSTPAGPVHLSDTFEVDSLASRQIVSVSDALHALKIDRSSASQSYVADLRDTITGVTAVIESIVGPVLPVTVDEWLDGGSTYVMLSRRPVISVSLVTESYGGGTTYTLTQQTPSGPSLDSYGYSLHPETGKLIRRVSGIAACFPAGRENIHAVYLTGRTVTPPNVRTAALELIRFNYIPQQSGNLGAWSKGSAQDADTAGSMVLGFFVPNRVMEQLAPDSTRVWAG